MRILFTNDDGYDSVGIRAVADLFKDDNEIAVVAPEAQRSGCSHSITLKPDPIPYKEVSGFGYKTFAVKGTPVDCLKLARCALFPKPDLVVSGINRGRNLGTDIMYSATVAVAMDAAHSGIRAVALSLDIGKHFGAPDNTSDEKYSEFARYFKANFDKFIGIKLPKRTFLNINYPSVSPKGIKITGMNTGETFIDDYSVTGDGIYVPSGYRNYDGLAEDTDEKLCLSGYITVTPLNSDITDYTALNAIKEIEFDS